VAAISKRQTACLPCYKFKKARMVGEFFQTTDGKTVSCLVPNTHQALLSINDVLPAAHIYTVVQFLASMCLNRNCNHQCLPNPGCFQIFHWCQWYGISALPPEFSGYFVTNEFEVQLIK